MSKYTIVEKSTKGNKQNCECVVKYQVEGYGSEIFKTSVIYVNFKEFNKPKYVFLSDKIGEHLDTADDREEFLLELEKYQKGGSYKKSNPIKLSRSMILRNRQKKLRDELSQLDHDIREAEDEEREDRFKTYKDDIDYDSLNNYLNALRVTIKNDRYYLKPLMHIWDGYKILVIDKKLDKPVYVGELNKDGIKFRDIEVYEI